MQGRTTPLRLAKKNRKKMEKKFYEMPEIEVVDLELEGALLSDSNTEVLDGDGDSGDLG